MKNLLIYVSVVALLFLAACSRDDKIVDSRVRVMLAAVNSDSLALLNVDYENLVKSYSSYLQGYETEWNLVETKFFLVNMYRKEILKELAAPQTPCGNCAFQLDESNLIFYDYEFPPFQVKKILKWNFEKNIVENLKISDQKVAFDTLNDKIPIYVFYDNNGVGTSVVRRFYFYLDEEENALKEVKMPDMQWKAKCLDFYYAESAFVCLVVDSGDVKLLDDEQNILDSVRVGQVSGIRFLGPKILIENRIYQIFEGKINMEKWLEIDFGRQGESFPIIFSNDSISVFYGKNDL